MKGRGSHTTRKPRQNKACSRCRKRKIRCDLQYPTCGACSIAGAACLGFDPIHGVDKPRSTTLHLEDEVSRLEKELAHVKPQTRSGSDIVNAAVERLSALVATNTVEPRGLTRKQDNNMLPLNSPFFLSSSPMPHLKSQFRGTTNDQHTRKHLESSSHGINVTSVPRHVVDAMLKHYCEIYRPQYPAIEESDLFEAYNRVYNNAQPSDADVFYVHITLAISTNTLIHQNETRAMRATHGFWTTAIAHLPQVGLLDPWERLQALQLLAHYGFLNPMDVDGCRCSEAATRLCLQLGLHHELPASTKAKLDNTTLNIRRRLFWHSYSIDSATHTARCQPFVLPTSAITAKFPDFHSESSPTRHMWLLRQIEAEITMTLYYPSDRVNGPLSDASFNQWFQRMHDRLNEWNYIILQNIDLSNTLEFHELHYHVQILRLNRVSPRCPNPTREMHKKALKSSAALIKKFSIIDRTGRLFYLWHAAHIIIESGICLLASVLTGMECTRRDQTHLAGEDITILSRYISAFPFLLSRVTRRWRNIGEHTAVLENICMRIFQKLQQWSDGAIIDQSDFSDLKQRVNSITLFPPLPVNTRSTIATDPGVSQQSITHEEKEVFSIVHQEGVAHPSVNHSSKMSAAEEVYPALEGSTTATFPSDHPSLMTSGFEVQTTADVDSFQSNWMDSQLLDPQQGSSSMLSDIHGIDVGNDTLAWDFAGMDPEQIISALLDTGTNTFLN